MSASILGKRTRSSLSAQDSSSSITTRAKRRCQFVILDDGENENPFVTPSKKTGIQNEESMDIDTPKAELRTTRKSSRVAGTVPAKHGKPESRVALSPAKITRQFKASKVSYEQEEKQIIEEKIPQTPRHRDSLLRTATTPRHRVLVAGKPPTPRTPRTPSTPRNATVSVYNEARQLFAKGAAPASLFGREQERKDLEEFVTTRVESTSSGCIYVSGPPGTGKSAFMSDISAKLAINNNVKVAYINCMSLKTAEDAYKNLLGLLTADDETLQGEPVDILKELFYGRECSYLITLDEVDHLLGLDPELMYTVFDWALDPSSSLILAGIANALDFADRFLPRLKARGLKPTLLPFLPYNASQIGAVVTSKLKSLVPASASDQNFVPVIHPTAIMFLSKKVAAQTGDLRKTFDICRRAIDLVEADTRDQHAKQVAELTPEATPSPTKTPLVENINLSSPPAVRSPSKLNRTTTLAHSLGQLDATTAPRATIAHMARITAAVFSNGTSQRLQNLNLQQKAVLCALAALEKSRSRSSITEPSLNTPSRSAGIAPTAKALFEAYTAMCKRDNILHALTNTEFRDIVGSLETLSLITAVEGKAGSLAGAGTPSRKGRAGFGTSLFENRRVASSVGDKELEASLTGVGSGILKEILNGDVL